MTYSRRIFEVAVRLSLTAFLTLVAGSLEVWANQTITVRSGNGPLDSQETQVRVLPYHRQGDVTPTVADFIAAQAGLFAYIVPPGCSCYIPSLPSDPAAKWIATTPGSNPESALYAVPFQVADQAISSATLDLAYSVDNAINGVFINGTRISGNSFDGDYHSEFRFVRNDIGPMLKPNSINWLYLNVSDYGGIAALIFRANITTQGTGPTSQAISPTHGGNSGNVTVTALGQNFQEAAVTTVLLRGAGPDVIGIAPQILDSSTIVSSFNLIGAAPGVRDMLVIQNGVTVAAYPASFTVEEGGSDQLAVDIIGPSRIRAGREGTFEVTVTNNGNVDAPFVTLQATSNPSVVASSLIRAVFPSQGGGCTLAPQNLYGAVGISRSYQLICGTLGATCVDLNASVKKEEPSDDCSKEEAAVASAEFRVNFLRTELQVLNNQLAILQQTYFGTCNPVTAQNAAECALLQQEINQKMSEIQQVRANLRQAQLDLLYAQAALDACRARRQRGSSSLLMIDNLLGAKLSRSSSSDVIKAVSSLSPTSTNSSLTFCGVTSVDPNDKLGVAGSGAANYIRPHLPLSYTILFENKPTATASAAEVLITDKLSAALDPSSLLIRDIRFGSTDIPFPLGLPTVNTSIDLRASLNLFLNISGQVVDDTLSIKFTSIDPGTGQPPNDLRGFLPPNSNPPAGEGSVTFTIMPRASLPTSTQITNQASIVFDTNSPILTPIWLNTIDNTKPVSNVLPLPANETSSSFTVRWSGTDIGAGIRAYTIYVSDNGGPFLPVLQDVAATQGTYKGVAGHTYRFFSIARDLSGNVEDIKTAAEAITTIVDNQPPTLSVVLSPNELWPPDHKLVTINASLTVSDDFDPAPQVILLSIQSSEPDDGLGDGDSPTDIQRASFGTLDNSFSLRAERSGMGQGRIYSVTYRATDAAGNQTTVTVPVTVPLNQRKQNLH